MDKIKKLFKHDKDESPSSTPSQSATSTSTSSAPPPQTSSISGAATSNAATTDKPAGVLLETNYGNITVALYSDKTPRVSLSTD